MFENRSRAGRKISGTLASQATQPLRKGRLLVTHLVPEEHPDAVLALCEAVQASDLAMRTDDPQTFARCLEGCGKDKGVFNVKVEGQWVGCCVRQRGKPYLKVWGRPFSYKAMLRNYGDAQVGLQRQVKALPMDLRIAYGF